MLPVLLLEGRLTKRLRSVDKVHVRALEVQQLEQLLLELALQLEADAPWPLLAPRPG